MLSLTYGPTVVNVAETFDRNGESYHVEAVVTVDYIECAGVMWPEAHITRVDWHGAEELFDLAPAEERRLQRVALRQVRDERESAGLPL